ncbi:DUF1302 domain-containing protein [Pseudomonas sp. Au-Pse12]|uniref:DUF1302 domain-containing protein n=1 Tax=Pseudomonas sp. Au-Pse12 TaxID=2906459 RepID=UPI001E61959C|nr:DUF1302 family protein [Pseudomonas sp. Au-Pse12]MCE4056968.1 DUF1302 domain-containing protein [Pseudomonas sp. Au-Pse12]
MKKTTTPCSRTALLATSVSLLLCTPPLAALEFEFNDEFKVQNSNVVSYGLAWRTAKPAHALSGRNNANGNDGNNAFKRGNLISHRLGVVSDADFSFRQDYGLFVRASAFYDDVYHRRNSNSSGTSNCFAAGQCARADQFSSDTRDMHGGTVEMLDNYLYGTWQVGGRPLNLRLGRQVVYWGESVYNGNGIASAMNPVDASKSNVPGVEVKERTLPTGQLFASYGLSEALDLQFYYQYEWKKTRLNAVGSYFSTSDLIDEGGYSNSTGQLLRLKDDKPRDSGQFGLGLRYVAQSLNNTEFGLYRLRYHSKTPVVDNLSRRGAYQARYYEDIQLYGASFATVVGDTNINGELSVQNRLPLAVNLGGARHTTRGKTAQVLLSMTHGFGQTPFSDTFSLTGEVGYNRVLSVDKAYLARRAPSDQLWNDRSAWGYTLRASARYIEVMPGWDLTIPLTFNQGVNGNSSLGSYNQGRNRLSLGGTLEYLGNLSLEATYNAYLGSPRYNSLADRDHIALNAKYSF